MKYIASVSFGKDSLAMLLRLIEEKEPLDEVIFYDTGMEFNAIYNIRDRIKKILEKHNIKFTEFKPKNSFLYDMFERKVKSKNGEIHKGYSWCGGVCRWGTTAKQTILDKYTKDNFVYIGIASDEKRRIEKNKNPLKIMPLVKWNMSEKDCLKYCYEKGFNWEENGIELYSILDRVSCWCCANKNLKELKNYYLYLPQYWQKLKDLQNKTNRPFKNNKYSINDLEQRFKKEIKKSK